MLFTKKSDGVKRSLAKRITLWYVLFFFCMSVGVLFTIYATSQQFIEQQEETQLHDVLKRFTRDFKQGKPFYDYEDSVYLSMYDEKGVFVQGTTPIGLSGTTFYDGQVAPIQTDTGYYLFEDVYEPTARVWIRGVIAVTNQTRYMQTLLRFILWLIPAVLLVTAISGYWIVRRALVPLYQMNRTVQEISHSLDLSKRVSLGQGNDEVYALGHAFNAMLDKVEQSYEREKQFTANVSHELRTPLAVIVSESQYGKDIATGESRESFEVIERQSMNMSKTVSQLLEIARLETEKTASFQSVALSNVVTREMSDLSLLAQEKGVVLTWDVEQDVFVTGDVHLLTRALGNLMSNALKFADSKVHVVLEKQDVRVLLRVSNDGERIEIEHQEKIFDRLYQIDDARHNREGNGLGLSYVKAIVSLHQGEIVVHSENDKTEFTIIL